MLKAIKVRVYPNREQQVYINQLLGCYRLVYNKCLNKKIEAYKLDKTSLGLSDLGHYFHHELTKDSDLYFLKIHNTKILKQSILNLLESYKNFYRNGYGFPKFKSKHDSKQSCRFPVDAISVKNDYSTSKLTLTSQLKDLKFRCSDQYKNYLVKNKGCIKSATLTKSKSGNYYLSILVDGDIEKILPKPKNQIIGIDLGIKDFIVTSNGEKFENIKIKKSNEKKLALLNRRLSKKKKGSKNKEKARIKLARFNEKLNNIKENYLHQVTNQLLNDNQVIVMESLNVEGMLKNHCLAKSIQELSLSHFKNILRYKSVWYGKTLIEIDQWFASSKLCSVCGYKNVNLTLKDRVWTCPDCGTNHDRDFNAALNIEKEGTRILSENKIGSRTAELTLVESKSLDPH